MATSATQEHDALRKSESLLQEFQRMADDQGNLIKHTISVWAHRFQPIPESVPKGQLMVERKARLIRSNYDFIVLGGLDQYLRPGYLERVLAAEETARKLHQQVDVVLQAADILVGQTFGVDRHETRFIGGDIDLRPMSAAASQLFMSPGERVQQVAEAVLAEPLTSQPAVVVVDESVPEASAPAEADETVAEAADVEPEPAEASLVEAEASPPNTAPAEVDWDLELYGIAEAPPTAPDQEVASEVPFDPNNPAGTPADLLELMGNPDLRAEVDADATARSAQRTSADLELEPVAEAQSSAPVIEPEVREGFEAPNVRRLIPRILQRVSGKGR
jgi:hypothetical protein